MINFPSKFRQNFFDKNWPGAGGMISICKIYISFESAPQSDSNDVKIIQLSHR